MNRWPGSATDSAEQASRRDQRAARRYIRTIPTINTDSNKFEDCNSSLTTPFINVNGTAEDDLAIEDTMPDNEAQAAAKRQAELANPFDIRPPRRRRRLEEDPQSDFPSMT